MVTYQPAAQSPNRATRTDPTVWALIAVVVVLVCATAGWAIARYDVPSQQDVAMESVLVGRAAQTRGERAGYAEGARLGRAERALQTRAEVATARRQAARDGYADGYQTGRSQAGDPDAFVTGSSAGEGTYPDPVAEASLRSGLFGDGDVPGYTSSAYGAYGYGVDGSLPYAGGAPYTSPGDGW